MGQSPIKSWIERDGKLQRVRLARPNGNIVDIEMIDALARVFTEIEDRHELRAVIMDHEGPHFGFGASIPEHLPDMVQTLVTKLHVLIKQMLHCPVPLLGVVRGQCLGGSLELALLWQIVIGSGFPNHFFCDSWVVGFWRGRPWFTGHWTGRPSLAGG